jgi:orotate phosphoribosyltransferase
MAVAHSVVALYINPVEDVPMNDRKLAQAIYKIAHLEGEFKLRSGLVSNEYFDKYRFEAQPRLLKAIAMALRGMIPSDTEVLAGLEMGGIPIATALALESGLPVVFVRKSAKEYGTQRVAEGLDSLKGLRICMIEDVVTTGGQVVMSAEDLRKEGALVNRVLCVISRQQGGENNLQKAGLELMSLYTQEQLKEAAADS